MKKIFLVAGLLACTFMLFANVEFTWHDMETKYADFYEKVLEDYSEERLQDLFNICSCAEKYNCKLTWETVKKLLDNPTELGE